MTEPDLPTEPGVYLERADDTLLELREDGLWYQAGRQLPFGTIELEPGIRGVAPADLRRDGVLPLERLRMPDHPPNSGE